MAAELHRRMGPLLTRWRGRGLLAERMAKRLDREDVADISLALAFLTSGIVHQHADDFTRARALVTGIRKLEDRLLESAYKAGPTRVH